VSVVDPRVSNGAWVRQLLSDRPTVRLLGAGIGIVATVAVLAAISWRVGNGFLAGDTLTYWFAGHRLTSATTSIFSAPTTRGFSIPGLTACSPRP
jgi:hypothetical protein